MFQRPTSAYQDQVLDLIRHSFEIGAIRPPSEGSSSSLLLRVTRNCPWNKCTFCYGELFNHQKFELRSIEEVKADIESVKAVAGGLRALS